MNRKFLIRVIEQMDEGLLDPQFVAEAALRYMSEADIEDMARTNDMQSVFADEEEEEEEYAND